MNIEIILIVIAMFGFWYWIYQLEKRIFKLEFIQEIKK